jgi:hypothetical protein
MDVASRGRRREGKGTMEHLDASDRLTEWTTPTREGRGVVILIPVFND